MIRHICMFKFKEENKEENIRKAIEKAEELLSKIKEIKKYLVVRNVSGTPATNYELSLIFDFASLEDLNTYKNHPDHIVFAEFIFPLRESRACLDYEF